MHPEVIMPANAVFEAVIRKPQAFHLGRKLNGLYGRIAVAKRFDEARQTAETFLKQYPLPDQYHILLGCIVSAYLNRTHWGVVWQLGGPGPDGKPYPGIRAKTIQALTGIGMAVRTEDGRQVYYDKTPPVYAALRVSSVWFYYYRQYAALKGLPVPEHYADIPESSPRGQDYVMLPDRTRQLTQSWAKARVKAKIEAGDFTGRRFAVRAADKDKLALFNEEGVRFGSISVTKSDPIDAGCNVTLRLCVPYSDDLSCIAEINAQTPTG